MLRELDLKHVINSNVVTLFKSEDKNTFCLSLRIPREFCDLVNIFFLLYNYLIFSLKFFFIRFYSSILRKIWKVHYIKHREYLKGQTLCLQQKQLILKIY